MLRKISQLKNSSKLLKRFIQSKILENSLSCQTTNFLISKVKLKESLSEYQSVYLDVSVFAKNDNKTGIQRVVREVVFQMLADNSLKNKVKFVVATKSVSYREVKFQVINDELTFSPINKKSSIIRPTQNDIFIGLDFCPHLVPYHFFTLIKWKKLGVKFAWVLYDMLPLNHPEWFTDNIKEVFRPWLNTILLVSDVVLCISKTVEKQAQKYAQGLGLECNLATIRLGYGFREQQNNNAYYDSTSILIKEQLKNTPFVLMVSTLEPRKGYGDIVACLNEIWDKKESDVAIVVVGRQGWNVEELMQTICNPKYKNKIYWLNSANDDLLVSLYQESLGVIVASYDEGYGLPLIEAIAHNKHVLVRDIEIFREVTQGHHNISFFAKSGDDLQVSLVRWLNDTIHQPVQKNTLTDDKNKGWNITLQDIKNSITTV